MKRSILAMVLACVLVVGSAGCQGTVQRVTGEAWDELKRIAASEGTQAAEHRIEVAKEELRAKGLDPEQIDSLGELLMAYLEKRDQSKGGLDFDLMFNLALAYMGVNIAKRKLMGPGPVGPIGPVGLTGLVGATGATGAAGAAGAPGANYS